MSTRPDKPKEYFRKILDIPEEEIDHSKIPRTTAADWENAEILLPVGPSSSVDQLRTEAWKKIIHSRGTAAIFSEHARRISKWSRIRDFLGIFVPLCVGAIVVEVSFINSQFISYLVAVTAVPSIFQLGVSLWSLVANWNLSYSKYIKSVAANNALCREWEAFGEQVIPTTVKSFRDLSQKTEAQEKIDYEDNLTPAEHRYGMRYGLREYQKACATCGEVPISMKPSKCDTCGNF